MWIFYYKKLTATSLALDHQEKDHWVRQQASTEKT